MSTMRQRLVMLVLWASVSFSAFGQASDSIRLDAATGNYVITYCCDSSGNIATAVFEPRTKVEPRIVSQMKQLDGNAIEYRYQIAIGAASPRPLGNFVVDPVSSFRSVVPLDFGNPSLSSEQERLVELNAELALSTPVGWKGFVNSSSRLGALRMGWRRGRLFEKNISEFSPGSSEQGFGFSSDDLPVVVVAQFRSKPTIAKSYAGEGPSPESIIMTTLTQLEQNDFVPRFTAAPGVPVSAAFICAPTLESIRNHVTTWPTQQLMATALTEEALALLQSAIDNCSSALSIQTAKDALVDVIALLEQSYPGFESDSASVMMSQGLVEHNRRLAARVLAFNARYVLSRI